MTLPNLTREDHINLMNLRQINPIAFYTDYTRPFLKFIDEGIRNAELQRMSLMGKPRSGKSEVGSALSFFYTDRFNVALKEGCFDNLNIKDDPDIKLEKITFDIEHVMASQSDYVYHLTEQHRETKIKFGQMWQIDESLESIGGLGSYSEKLELKNINNIVPKFMQSELWLTPPKLEDRNCFWGIRTYKKDIIRRINFCLLYDVQHTPRGTPDYVFRGWLAVPLHKNEGFRIRYNLKKDEWIKNVLANKPSGRNKIRSDLAQELVNNERYRTLLFDEISVKGGYRTNRTQQISLLNMLIGEDDWKHGSFNMLEIDYIVELARKLYTLRLKGIEQDEQGNNNE